MKNCLTVNKFQTGLGHGSLRSDGLARPRSAWAALLSATLLSACGGGGSSTGSPSTPVPVTPAPPVVLASGYPNSPVTCSTDGQRAWLRDYMDDEYFWYTQQGVPNAAATSMDDYLFSLLNKPIDRYSFAESTAAADQFFVEGTRTGYGYSLGWADAAQTVLKVRIVEPLSPLGQGNLLRRGDTIVSIDGFTPAQVVAGQVGSVSTQGVPRTFVVRNDVGVQRTFTISSLTFVLSPVITSQILTAPNGAKVGYLMYEEFITTGSAALGTAFASFRAANVQHLILDFRYNGGGSTAQARDIASMVGGSSVAGKVFAQYRFNARYTAENFNQTFKTSGLPAQPLEGIGNVMVITSGDTASASEVVINSLRPHKNVVTVGSTTFGKPYAFLPISACGITYSAVNLEVANSVGFADFSSGFAPACPVADDLTRQLGDPLEARTAAALGYIATGRCPTVNGQVKSSILAATRAGSSTSASTNASPGQRRDSGLGEMGPRATRVD